MTLTDFFKNLVSKKDEDGKVYFTEETIKELESSIEAEFKVFATEFKEMLEENNKNFNETIKSIKKELSNEIAKKVALNPNSPKPNDIDPKKVDAIKKYF